MSQFARPSTVISNSGNYTGTPDPAMWPDVNESVESPDDTGYIYSPAAPSNAAVRLGCFASVITPWGGSSNGSDHFVRVRAFKDASSLTQMDMVVTLYQGVTQIAQFTQTSITTTPTTYTFTLTAGQANSITDYNDLRIDISANQH